MRLSSPTTARPAQPYASRSARLTAFALDALFWMAAKAVGSILGLSLGLAAQSHAVLTQPADEVSSALLEGSSFGWAFWGFAAFVLNWGILQGMTGATLGKHLMQLRVVQRSGAPLTILGSLFRTMLYGVSSATFGLGLLPILWTRQRRAAHDWLAGTVVITQGARLPQPELRPIRLPVKTSPAQAPASPASGPSSGESSRAA